MFVNDDEWTCDEAKGVIEAAGGNKVTVLTSIRKAVDFINNGNDSDVDVVIIDAGIGGVSPDCDSGIQLACLFRDRGVLVGLVTRQASLETFVSACKLGLPIREEAHIGSWNEFIMTIKKQVFFKKT